MEGWPLPSSNKYLRPRAPPVSSVLSPEVPATSLNDKGASVGPAPSTCYFREFSA